MAIISLALMAIVTVAGGLGYQAHAANRANVATARRALTQYSSVAVWQFSRRAQREMQMAADATIGMRVQHALHGQQGASVGLLTPAELRAAANTGKCDCQSPLRVDHFFRWDVGSADVVGEGEWSERDRRALAARLAGDARDPNGDRHLSAERLAADGRYPTDQRGTRWSHANCDLLVDTDVAGQPRLLAVVAAYDDGHHLRAIYGAVVPIGEASTVFERALDRESLLPTALLSRAAQDSALAVDVAVRGQSIFERGRLNTADFVAADSLGTTMFGAAVRAGLMPTVAGRLLIGGLPRSRLPLIGVFLAIAVVLFAIALRQVWRTAELARLRSDFVSSVSHELRTPLSLVRVYTETLIDDDPVAREDRTRFLGVILKESNRLGRLVENLLRFADLERHTVAVTLAPANLGELLTAAIADFRPLAETSGIEIQGDFPRGLTALIDAAALRQMIFNLLANAVKFSAGGGLVRVTLTHTADSARITVDDAGPGIPIAHRRRVFERFVRLKDVNHGAPAGSGIGLAIVRELAHAQRMSVWIDDSPLGGARVVLAVATLDAQPGADDEPTVMAVAEIQSD